MTTLSKLTKADLTNRGLEADDGVLVYEAPGTLSLDEAYKQVRSWETMHRPFGSFFDLEVIYILSEYGVTNIWVRIFGEGYSHS